MCTLEDFEKLKTEGLFAGNALRAPFYWQKVAGARVVVKTADGIKKSICGFFSGEGGKANPNKGKIQYHDPEAGRFRYLRPEDVTIDQVVQPTNGEKLHAGKARKKSKNNLSYAGLIPKKTDGLILATPGAALTKHRIEK